MDERKILVSIALVVYNHEKYLREAIESILMQKVNFEYEIVVGEDKSTDKSRNILMEYKQKYPDKFVLLFRDENVGGTRNLYEAFTTAKGKYLTCLEGDDYWIDEYKLQKQVDFLENNKDYLGVSNVIEARDLQGNYMSRYPSSPNIVGKDVTINIFLKGYYFSATATVFRNIFLDKSTDNTIYYKAHKIVGDLTLCMLLLDKGKIKVLNETMSVYRCRRTEGESNYNSIRDVFQQYNDHIQLINKINEHFKYKYNFSREYIDRSTDMFLYGIRNGGFNKIKPIVNLIPQRIKFKFYILLPYKTLKKVILKCISIIKNLVRSNNEPK